MSTKENFCTDCERDCSAPQCLHCVNGSEQIKTTMVINYEPTFTVRRVVLKGSEDMQLSLFSKTDRRK